jgi:hypothetical protein
MFQQIEDNSQQTKKQAPNPRHAQTSAIDAGAARFVPYTIKAQPYTSSGVSKSTQGATSAILSLFCAGARQSRSGADA